MIFFLQKKAIILVFLFQEISLLPRFSIQGGTLSVTEKKDGRCRCLILDDLGKMTPKCIALRIISSLRTLIYFSAACCKKALYVQFWEAQRKLANLSFMDLQRSEYNYLMEWVCFLLCSPVVDVNNLCLLNLLKIQTKENLGVPNRRSEFGSQLRFGFLSVSDQRPFFQGIKTIQKEINFFCCFSWYGIIEKIKGN